MGKLKSIDRQPLLFPSMEIVNVVGCGKLKKLPFRHVSAKNIKYIKGSSERKDHLEWDHENIQSKFTPYLNLGNDLFSNPADEYIYLTVAMIFPPSTPMKIIF